MTISEMTFPVNKKEGCAVTGNQYKATIKTRRDTKIIKKTLTHKTLLDPPCYRLRTLHQALLGAAPRDPARGDGGDGGHMTGEAVFETHERSRVKTGQGRRAGVRSKKKKKKTTQAAFVQRRNAIATLCMAQMRGLHVKTCKNRDNKATTTTRAEQLRNSGFDNNGCMLGWSSSAYFAPQKRSCRVCPCFASNTALRTLKGIWET